MIVCISEKAYHDVYRAIPSPENRTKVCTPKNAVQFLGKNEADLVLLDGGTGDERALEMLEQIKALKPHLPIIMLLDQPASHTVIRAFRSGARDIVTKPVDIFELRRLIHELLTVTKSSKERRAPMAGIRDRNKQTRLPPITTDKPPFVLRAIRYIEDNLEERISLDILAEEAHLSKFHFTRRFHRHTGMSPLKFAAALRMEKAKTLLRNTDLTVSSIAYAIGYDSVSNFTRQFKKATTLSPSEYRTSLRNK